MNLEVRERYLSIIEGAGTPFPYVPRHFNHWTQVIDARLCISPKVWAYVRKYIHGYYFDKKRLKRRLFELAQPLVNVLHHRVQLGFVRRLSTTTTTAQISLYRLLSRVHSRATELNWTAARALQPCNQSTSWRWRACPITRRVTGSTWCRSVQFSSPAVNTALEVIDWLKTLNAGSSHVAIVPKWVGGITAISGTPMSAFHWQTVTSY